MDTHDKAKQALQLFQNRQFKEAIEMAQSLLLTDPSNLYALMIMGDFSLMTGQTEEAIRFYKRCLEIRPGEENLMAALGKAQNLAGLHQEALATYQAISKKNPQSLVALLGIGETLYALRVLDIAGQALQSALQVNPNLPQAHLYLGKICKEQNAPVEQAIAHCNKAIQIDPNFKDAYYDLAQYYTHAGDPAAACATYEKVLGLGALETPNIHSNLLLTLHYRHDLPREVLYHHHKNWHKQHAPDEVRTTTDFANSPNPEKKLRVGFTSADLYSHAVFFFVHPLFSSYDRTQFEFICFSGQPAQKEDHCSQILKEHVDEWHCVHGFNTPKLDQLIREKKIDILVDLSGHTSHNRLEVYLKRAAPVQATWLGYPNTTGLESMDYRIVDEVTDPTPWADDLASESLYRIPAPFLCFQPHQHWHQVSGKTELTPGKIIFGSFNNAPKLNESAVSLWCQILQQVPEAELTIKCRSFGKEKTQDFILNLFRQHGIEETRLTVMDYIPSNQDHLDTYNSIDIALDPFPYNGTTTTCDALWMGVPVLTKKGDRHSSRVGMTLLKSVGLNDWITTSDQEYVQKAAAIAKDREKLTEIKRSLRQRMLNSPLCDSQGFARKFETALRTMWKTWCNTPTN